MSEQNNRPGEFRRQLLQMLNGHRGGDRFEPTTDEPKRSTRARRPRKSTAKRQRRNMTPEKSHAGDDGDQAGAD